jgi:asparagine synthase (glutamine-hydrolysing)
MRMDAIGRRTEQWYQLPEFTRELNRDEDCDGLLAAIEESVRIHLRSSRRVASCLSGGLDSSTLVQLVGRHLEEAGKNFSAFTINSAHQRDSEVDLAREVTANARLPHQIFDVQTAIPAIDALDMAIAYEIPNHVIGPINQFLLLRQIARTGATVVLDGQGGDELVSGYTWWFPVLVADMRRRGKHAEADSIEAQRPLHLPFDAPTTRRFDQIFYDPEAWLGGFMGKELLGLKLAEVAEQPEFRYYFEHDGSWEGFRQRAYQTDTLHFLLRQEDRLGMRFGLECRVPFVDTEVVRAAARLAPELLIRDGYLKYPLRRMRSGIPESVRWTARKRGFWETAEARFPWMSGLAFQFAMQSTLVPQMFPRLEEDWHTTRSDQQWRILQIALLERCPTRADAEDALRDMEPVTYWSIAAQKALSAGKTFLKRLARQH